MMKWMMWSRYDMWSVGEVSGKGKGGIPMFHRKINYDFPPIENDIPLSCIYLSYDVYVYVYKKERE